VGLAAIFYCLRFQTALFVASYDSQDYGGGIRPRLHTGLYPSEHGVTNMTVAGQRFGKHISEVMQDLRCWVAGRLVRFVAKDITHIITE
jgi:hypothetical protein